MKFVVLAAGGATRLRALGTPVQKGLIGTKYGSPFDSIWAVMQSYSKASGEPVELVCVVNQANAGPVVRHYGERAVYCVQGGGFGLVDAIRSAKPVVQDDRFAVFCCDNAYENVAEIAHAISHLSRASRLGITAKPMEQYWKYGVLQVEGIRPLWFVEKPEQGEFQPEWPLCWQGVLVADSFCWFDQARTVSDAVNEAIGRGYFAFMKIEREVVDVGTLEGIVEAQGDVQTGQGTL